MEDDWRISTNNYKFCVSKALVSLKTPLVSNICSNEFYNKKIIKFRYNQNCIDFQEMHLIEKICSMNEVQKSSKYVEKKVEENKKYKTERKDNFYHKKILNAIKS
jgi:hypothetical protein